MADESKSSNVVKLISVDQSKSNEFSITPEAVSILDGHGNVNNLNLIFIFGNARSGKSFLMNQLVRSAGGDGKFKVVNQSEPCTKGVDMSSFIIDQKEYASIGIDKVDETDGDKIDEGDKKGKTLLGFVDVEGQGADQEEKYDTLLALPLLLTGKVILFNHKGAPTVHDMLSRLGVIARAAEYITTLAEDEDEDEDEGDTDEDEDDEIDGTKAFGHLHVCFRDFSFRGTTEDVLDQLLQDENLPKKSMKQDNSKIQAIRERNDIRNLLRKNFESINASLFRQPADPDQLKKHAELPHELIDVEFSNTLEELRDQIIEQTKEPRLFNGIPITGARLGGLLKKIVGIINSGIDIDVPSVFRAMEQEVVQRSVEVTLEEFEKLVKEIELPLAEEPFNNQINVAKAKVLEVYEAKLITCTLKEEVEKGKENFMKKALDIINLASKENTTASWAYAKDKVLKEVAALKQEYVKWCTEQIPTEESAMFQSKYEQMQFAAAKSLAGKLTHLPHILSDPKFERLMKVEQEKVDVVVQVQEAKNKAELNEMRVKKILEETEKMKRQLQETQNNLLKKISETTEKANRDIQIFKEKEDIKYTKQFNFVTEKHKSREDKLIRRAEELLEIKRLDAKKIEDLQSEIFFKERGYLEKRGRRNQNYQVRWFEIVETPNSKFSELRYYGKQEDTKAKGIILLDQKISVDYVDQAKGFCIHGLKRDYNLRASNIQDALAWVTSLRERIHQ